MIDFVAISVPCMDNLNSKELNFAAGEVFEKVVVCNLLFYGHNFVVFVDVAIGEGMLEGKVY